MKLDLKRTFEESSKKTLEVGLDPSFWIFAVVGCALIAPFSIPTALTLLCAPAAYAALGFAYAGMGKGVEALSGNAPKP